MVSCGSSVDVAGQLSEVEEIVENLERAGFPSSEIEVREGGEVIVGGDAVVSLQASREMVGASDDGFRQYRTHNFVDTSEFSTICVRMWQPPTDYSVALDEAISNFNELPLSFDFVRVDNPEVFCDDTIFVWLVDGTGGQAGFPSHGEPFGIVQLGDDIVATYGVSAATHVIMHELGHAMGFRHSDFYDRSISCGVGVERASRTVRSIFRGPPPEAVFDGSVMNACYHPGVSGEWSPSDVVALIDIYGEDPPCAGGAPCHRVDCLDILENGESTGDGRYTIDPDGVGPIGPFDVICDMTTHGGGWTLIGKGQYQSEWFSSRVDYQTNDALLEPSKLGGLLGAGHRVFRHDTSTGEQLFVVDDEPVFDSFYWRTNGELVSCANDVASVDGGSAEILAAKSVSCDAAAVGTHECGTSEGWLLTHVPTELAFAPGGQHPCPVGGTLTQLWSRRGGAPLPTTLRQDCEDILDNGESTGDGLYAIDPDGAGPGEPFTVYCDMTTDGGGWTLIGRGQYHQDFGSGYVGPTATDEMLEASKLGGLLGAGHRVFRHRTDAGEQLFVVDDEPIFDAHFWRSNSASLECASDIASVDGGTAETVTDKAVSCDPYGVGVHTCGTTAGWILTHITTQLTFDPDGQHPCPTNGNVLDIWSRR